MAPRKESFWSFVFESIGSIGLRRPAPSAQTSRKKKNASTSRTKWRQQQRRRSKRDEYKARLYTKERVKQFQLRAADRKSKKLSWMEKLVLEPIVDVEDEMEKEAEALVVKKVSSSLCTPYEDTGMRGMARSLDGVWEEKGKGVARRVDRWDSAYSMRERNNEQVDVDPQDNDEDGVWEIIPAYYYRNDETDSDSPGPSRTTYVHADEWSLTPPTEDENWPPAVIADEDIPQNVELGLYRFALANPEQVPWWVLGDKHFHRLESERFERLVLAQPARIEERTAALKVKPTHTLWPKPSVEPSVPFNFPSPQTTTAVISTPLPTKQRPQSTSGIAKKPYERSTHRRPSSLDTSDHITAAPPTRSLPVSPPPPVFSGSATSSLLERAAQSVRVSRSRSAGRSGTRQRRRSAHSPSPPAAVAIATAPAYEEASKAFFHQETLDMLEGTIPAPEWDMSKYVIWALRSPWQKGYPDPLIEAWKDEHREGFEKWKAERREKTKEKKAGRE